MNNGNNFEPSWGYVWGIRFLVAFAIVALVAIWLVGYYGSIADRFTFVTVNTLTVLAFVVIVITAFTNREMARVQKHQALEAELQRKAAQRAGDLTADIVSEMKAQREIADTQIAQTGLQLVSARDQTIEMIGQRDIMLGQLAAMEAQQVTFNVGERAYVCIGKITVPKTDELPKNTIGSDGFIRFKLKLVNSGRTPAFNVRVRSFQCNTHVFDSDTIFEKGENGLKTATNESTPRIILAGKDATIWHSPVQTLSTAEIEEWIAEDKKRYVYIPVKLSYEDIHGDTHSLTYWYQFFHAKGFSIRKPLVLEVRKYKKKTNKRKKAN